MDRCQTALKVSTILTRLQESLSAIVVHVAITTFNHNPAETLRKRVGLITLEPDDHLAFRVDVAPTTIFILDPR
jgi:hypothetical protein